MPFADRGFIRAGSFLAKGIARILKSFQNFCLFFSFMKQFVKSFENNLSGSLSPLFNLEKITRKKLRVFFVDQSDFSFSLDKFRSEFKKIIKNCFSPRFQFKKIC